MPALQPLCVAVTGPPGAGKTTLATRLAGHYGWSLVTKDHYKELVFDALGWSDRAWSRRVSVLAWELCFDAVGRVVASGGRVVLEGNLGAAEWQRLTALCERHRSLLLPIECRADDALLVARATARATGRLRHPGHADAELLGEYARTGGWPAVPVPVADALAYDANRAAAGPAEYLRLVEAIDCWPGGAQER